MTTTTTIDYRAAALRGLRPYGWWYLPVVVCGHGLSGIEGGSAADRLSQIAWELDRLAAEGAILQRPTRWGPAYAMPPLATIGCFGPGGEV